MSHIDKAALEFTGRSIERMISKLKSGEFSWYSDADVRWQVNKDRRTDRSLTKTINRLQLRKNTDIFMPT